MVELFVHAGPGAEVARSGVAMSMPLFVTGLRQIFGRGLRELR